MNEALGIELEAEEDGRWIAELMRLPGAIAYGKTRQAAIERVLSILRAERTSASMTPTAEQPGVVFALIDDEPMGPRLLDRMARRIPQRKG
jgi:hypothetical protein